MDAAACLPHLLPPILDKDGFRARNLLGVYGQRNAFRVSGVGVLELAGNENRKVSCLKWKVFWELYLIWLSDQRRNWELCVKEVTRKL